jgi:hypothetical protein
MNNLPIDPQLSESTASMSRSIERFNFNLGDGADSRELPSLDGRMTQSTSIFHHQWTNMGDRCKEPFHATRASRHLGGAICASVSGLGYGKQGELLPESLTDTEALARWMINYISVWSDSMKVEHKIMITNSIEGKPQTTATHRTVQLLSAAIFARLYIDPRDYYDPKAPADAHFITETVQHIRSKWKNMDQVERRKYRV